MQSRIVDRDVDLAHARMHVGDGGGNRLVATHVELDQLHGQLLAGCSIDEALSAAEVAYPCGDSQALRASARAARSPKPEAQPVMSAVVILIPPAVIASVALSTSSGT